MTGILILSAFIAFLILAGLVVLDFVRSTQADEEREE